MEAMKAECEATISWRGPAPTAKIQFRSDVMALLEKYLKLGSELKDSEESQLRDRLNNTLSRIRDHDSQICDLCPEHYKAEKGSYKDVPPVGSFYMEAREVLRECILKKMEDKSDYVKEWISGFLSDDSKSLDKKKRVKPEVKLSSERTWEAAQSSKPNIELPVEIACIIYSHCDLESSVELRLASSFWYRVFQLSEKDLEIKIRSRSPFLEPDAEMSTWGDCALVFASRIKTWTPFRKMDEMELARETLDWESFVTAPELELGTPLPKEFDSLDCVTSTIRNIDFHESRVLELRYSDGEREARLDPYTLESKMFPTWEEDMERMEVIHQDGKTLVKTRAVKIWLPSTIPRERFRTADGSPPIKIYVHWIQVTTDVTTFVIPRKPKNGLRRFSYGSSYVGFEIGKVYVIRSSADTRSKSRFHFWDPHGNRWVDYGCYHEGIPFAVHKGLIWWQFEKGNQLISTFPDLQTSEPKRYYNRFRGTRITTSEFDTGEYLFFRQVRKQGNTHLAAGNDPWNCFVIDLDVGSVTRVDHERSWTHDGDKFFVGFIDGKFEARFMAHNTVMRYTMSAWGLTEYDVDMRSEYESSEDDD